MAGNTRGAALPAPIGDGDELTTAQLIIVTGARLALVAAFRIIYPLQPFLTSELAIDLRTVGLLITVQLAASMLSPLGGALADTRGERLTMLAGLAAFALGTIFCAVSPSFGAFLGGYALIGIAVALYQPAAQAYLSARTPYARRGWALGIFETSWALGALVGVAPLMIMVQSTQRSAPVFWALFIACLISLALLWLTIPKQPAAARHEPRKVEWGALRAPGALAVLLFMALILCAYDMFLIVQAPWLEQTLMINEAQLGQLFALAGIGELFGSMGVALLGDRIGIRRSAAVSFVLAAACIVLMPMAGERWEWLLPTYVFFFVVVEYGIVATFPLASAVAPLARGTMLALSTASTGGGRVVASLIATPLWLSYGIGWMVATAAAIMLAALLLLASIRPAEE